MSAEELLMGTMLALGNPGLSHAQLAALADPFGVPGQTMRPALSRMRRTGLVAAETIGGKSVYRLGPRAARVGRNASSRFRPLDWSDWDGSWRGVVYSAEKAPSARSGRARFRRKLEAFHFARLEDGFWIRPYSAEEEARTGFAEAVRDDGARLIRFAPEEPGFVAEASALWPLEAAAAEMAATAEDFFRQDADGLSPAEAHRRRMEVGDRAVKTLRKDPLLPAALLPAGWKADDLRTAFLRLDGMLEAKAAPFYARLGIGKNQEE